MSRRILENACLNWLLDSIDLVYSIRKPFDALVEEPLLKESGVDRTPVELFLTGIGEWTAAVRRMVDDHSG